MIPHVQDTALPGLFRLPESQMELGQLHVQGLSIICCWHVHGKRLSQQPSALSSSILETLQIHARQSKTFVDYCRRLQRGSQFPDHTL